MTDVKRRSVDCDTDYVPNRVGCLGCTKQDICEKAHQMVRKEFLSPRGLEWRLEDNGILPRWILVNKAGAVVRECRI